MADRPPPYYSSSIRDRYRENDKKTDEGKGLRMQNELQQDFRQHGKYQMKIVDQKNILLIGRTRTGKSTIKSLLIDPSRIPDAMTLKSGTRDPQFQAFYLKDENTVLNIIDTPGLFEQSNNQVDVRDNEMIMKTIGMCINMEITKFHAVCFCVSLAAGINTEDTKALELLVDYLGPEVQENACLIITRCESVGKADRDKLKKELMEDLQFKKIAPFFKLGVFFSGSINREDCSHGSENVYRQYSTICDYRETLIKCFLDIKTPVPIERMAATSPKFAAIYRTLPTAQYTSGRSYNNRPSSGYPKNYQSMRQIVCSRNNLRRNVFFRLIHCSNDTKLIFSPNQILLFDEQQFLCFCQQNENVEISLTSYLYKSVKRRTNRLR